MLIVNGTLAQLQACAKRTTGLSPMPIGSF